MPRIPSRGFSEPVHILSVTKSTGGLAAYNRTFSEQLNDRGYEVSVLCLSEGNESYARALGELGISALTMEMARYSIAPISDLRLAIRLVRHLRRTPPHLIVGHGAKAGFLSRLAGRIAGVPALYVMHSTPFLPRVQGRWAIFYRQLERIGALVGGHIITISRSMRDEVKRSRVAPGSGVTVVYTGIDVARQRERREPSAARRALGLDPRHPVIGWAGRFNVQKAPFDFVRAAELVARSVPDVQFFMAGEGPLAEDVRTLADRLGLGNRLIVAGWQDDMATVLSALDVYSATSRWEGLPLSLLEAMAAERVVVATAVDGVVEIIRHGVDGFLVDGGDTQAMAGNFQLLLLDDQRRTEVGRAARKRILDCFTVERMMDAWEDVIQRQLPAKR